MADIEKLVGSESRLEVGMKINEIVDYKANKNLTNTGMITNCITEIPQRIKLELNNGVLTLKAGSVVIIPNGFEADGTTLKFDYETVENDISTSGGTAGTRLAFYHINAESFLGVMNTYVYSGDTAKMNSTSAATYSRFYNTQTNKIYIGNSNGGSWVETRAALPICIFRNVETNIVASLDQVFNGMGYIGSHVWVDKGVKGLLPNGINEDGTLRNIEWVNPSLKLTSRNTTGLKPLTIGIGRSIVIGSSPYTESATPLPATGSGYSMYLNTSENIFYINSGSAWNASQNFLVATLNMGTDGVINGLDAKQPFRAMDYNNYAANLDGEWIAKSITLAEEVTFSNNNETTFSLAGYLPDDNNVYEIIISLAGNTTNVCHYNISTGYNAMVGFLTRNIAGAFITTPVSTARLLRFFPTSTASGTNKISVRVTAYRKVR